MWLVCCLQISLSLSSYSQCYCVGRSLLTSRQSCMSRDVVVRYKVRTDTVSPIIITRDHKQGRHITTPAMEMSILVLATASHRVSRIWRVQSQVPYLEECYFSVCATGFNINLLSDSLSHKTETALLSVQFHTSTDIKNN